MIKPSLISPKHLKSKVLLKAFGEFVSEEWQKEDGSTFTYYRFESTPYACMTLPITKEGKCILNFEYRPPSREILLSCPGGLVEDNEDPKEAALRELYEETGYQAKSAVFLGESFPFPGLCGQKTYFYLMKDSFLKGPPAREASELIETIECTLDEVYAYIEAKKPMDGMLIQALYFYKRLLENT